MWRADPRADHRRGESTRRSAGRHPRPAVRLDRSQNVPLELLMKALARRLVGHRQRDGQRELGRTRAAVAPCGSIGPSASRFRTASDESAVQRRAFRGRRHDLVREPDAGNPHVRFDARRLETESRRGVRHRQWAKPPGTATVIHLPPPRRQSSTLPPVSSRFGRPTNPAWPGRGTHCPHCRTLDSPNGVHRRPTRS